MPPSSPVRWPTTSTPSSCSSSATARVVSAPRPEGLERADTSGVHLLDFRLHSMRVYGAMLARDWELARRHLDRMHERLDVVPMIDVGYYEFLVAWHAAIVGDLSRADRHARQARALAEDAGLPSLVALSSFLTAQLEHERGDRAGAREHLVRVHATAVAQFERMGRTLEARGDVERALGWCLRGLAADELADGLYLGAARCDRTTGRDRSALALLRHAERLREVAVPDSPSRTA